MLFYLRKIILLLPKSWKSINRTLFWVSLTHLERVGWLLDILWSKVFEILVTLRWFHLCLTVFIWNIWSIWIIIFRNIILVLSQLSQQHFLFLSGWIVFWMSGGLKFLKIIVHSVLIRIKDAIWMRTVWVLRGDFIMQ